MLSLEHNCGLPNVEERRHITDYRFVLLSVMSYTITHQLVIPIQWNEDYPITMELIT